MDLEQQTVKLYIYDLTQGMAKMMSQMLIGELTIKIISSKFINNHIISLQDDILKVFGTQRSSYMEKNSFSVQLEFNHVLR